MKKFELKMKKSEPKEQTMTGGGSGAFEGPIEMPVISRKIEATEQTTSAVSAGAAFDVPFGGGGTKGKKNPLSIDGKKSIGARRTAMKKNKTPMWGGPGSKFVKVKEKCKKFPYCDEGPGAIEIANESKKSKDIFMDMKNSTLNSIIEKTLTNEVKKRIISEQIEKTIEPMPFTVTSNKIVGEPILEGKKMILNILPMENGELNEVIKKLHKRIHSPVDIEVNENKIIITPSDEFGGQEEIKESIKQKNKMKKVKKLNEEPCLECNQNMGEEKFDETYIDKDTDNDGEADDLKSFVGKTQQSIDEGKCPKCGKAICECDKSIKENYFGGVSDDNLDQDQLSSLEDSLKHLRFARRKEEEYLELLTSTSSKFSLSPAEKAREHQAKVFIELTRKTIKGIEDTLGKYSKSQTINPENISEGKKKTLRLKESSLIEMINRIISEAVPGVEMLKTTRAGSKREADAYQKDLTKKMKDYDNFEGNDKPEFPKQIGKGEKVAYRNSKEDDDYVDENRGRGPEDLKLDNDDTSSDKYKERLKKAIEDGDKPGKDVANVTDSEAGKKTFKNIEKRRKSREKEPMYKKDAQPIKTEKVNEEIKKMMHLVDYNKKTQ